jgi:hypothetical protein
VIYYDRPLAADKADNADKWNYWPSLEQKDISHQTVGCAMALLTSNGKERGLQRTNSRGEPGASVRGSIARYAVPIVHGAISGEMRRSSPRSCMSH